MFQCDRRQLRYTPNVNSELLSLFVHILKFMKSEPAWKSFERRDVKANSS